MALPTTQLTLQVSRLCPECRQSLRLFGHLVRLSAKWLAAVLLSVVRHVRAVIPPAPRDGFLWVWLCTNIATALCLWLWRTACVCDIAMHRGVYVVGS
jgi:hypothetical protein